MKTILVATDYSNSAESALKYAAFLASFTKADVELFSNYTFNIHALNGLITASAMDDIIRKNQLRLQEYAEKMSLKYNRPLKTHSLTSMTEESFDEFVEKSGASLIVMGMNKNEDENHLSGIASNIIVKNTRLPVLVVPEHVAIKMPERVLYACDYQALPGKEHLQTLKEIAGTFGSELQVFHVYKTGVFAEATADVRAAMFSEIESAMSSIDHFYRDVKANDFLKSLKEGIKDFDADILVMSPHKYGFWESMIHKSKTREMILKSNLPLLSIPS